MLYEFRSRATGSVTMVGKAAEQVLKIIGKSPDATGIITVAQIPAAIAALHGSLLEGRTLVVNEANNQGGRPGSRPTGPRRSRRRA